jgi:hypothetical protein
VALPQGQNELAGGQDGFYWSTELLNKHYSRSRL